MAITGNPLFHAVRAVSLSSAIVVLLQLPGCAQFCGDTGTRYGAWGLVFRCHTGAPRDVATNPGAGVNAGSL